MSLSPFVPTPKFEDYQERFKHHFKLERRADGVLLAQAHTPGSSIQLSVENHRALGQLFKTIGKHVAPPAGIKSPALWGTQARMAEMFGPQAVSITAEPRNFVFRYRSPEHWLEVFKTYYGPLLKAFAALDAAGQGALEYEVFELIARFNRARDGSVVVPSKYLEIVITRQ